MANIPTEVPLTRWGCCGGMAQRYVEWPPTATTGATTGGPDAHLPAEPRRALRPRRRAQRRLLRGRARLPHRHAHARGGLRPGARLHQRPRHRPLPDRRRGRRPRRPGGAPSASTTWPGRSTPWPSSGAWPTALPEAGALVGASDHGTTKSLYAKDPDGLEFEVCWVVPADLLTPTPRRPRAHRPARPGPRARALRRRDQGRHRHLGPLLNTGPAYGRPATSAGLPYGGPGYPLGRA